MPATSQTLIMVVIFKTECLLCATMGWSGRAGKPHTQRPLHPLGSAAILTPATPGHLFEVAKPMYTHIGLCDILEGAAMSCGLFILGSPNRALDFIPGGSRLLGWGRLALQFSQ